MEEVRLFVFLSNGFGSILLFPVPMFLWIVAVVLDSGRMFNLKLELASAICGLLGSLLFCFAAALCPLFWFGLIFAPPFFVYIEVNDLIETIRKIKRYKEMGRWR